MRTCPNCNANTNEALPFLAKNLDTSKLSSFSFASRKTPEYMCHEMVRCTRCDLVYACDPPDSQGTHEAYHQASYDSSEEANDAALTYIRAIQQALIRIPQRESALEIGCGTGIFLKYLHDSGFKELVGVEPSRAAIDCAAPMQRAWIREGIFREEDFQPASFDLVCCFMTLEHIHDPRQLVESALRILRPGGVFVSITHDYRSFTNRLLGKKSPIVDIEHLQLFSRLSVTDLFERSGFENVTVKAFYNSYTLRYWLRLSPIPAQIKSLLTSATQKIRMLRNLRISVNVGNIITFGSRPL